MKKEAIRIIPAEECDLPDILQLQYSAYQSEAILYGNANIPPLKQTLPELREDFQQSVVLKAVDEADKIIGSVRFHEKNGTVFIGKLMVAPEKQRRGIGSALLKFTECRSPGKRLELFTGNRSISNLALYEKCGYHRFKEQLTAEGLTMVYLEKQRSCPVGKDGNIVPLKILSLRKHPELLEKFIAYFVSHWNNEAVYRDCMTACLQTASPLPQWYLLMDGETIVGGCGLIVNDFNARQDLWPWLCALYIEEEYRGHAYGAMLLAHAGCEASALGFSALYLVTDHVGYYEKYGFDFIGMTADPFGGTSRIYRSTACSGENNER